MTKHLIEQAIPWDPIPRAANVYMECGVVHFEQQDDEGTPVSCVVIGSLDGRGGASDEMAWRITFHGATAFRYGAIDAQRETPLVYPTWDGAHKVACWEIAHSRWLRAAVSPEYSRPSHLHHFVIADSYVLYEVIAEWWEASELGSWERVRSDMGLSR